MKSAIGSLAIALSVTACVSTPARPPVADPAQVWQARRLALTPLNVWEIQGRLALKTADEGWQVALHWIRAADQHDIDLSGPLGGGRVRVTQDRNGARLRDSEQRTYYAANARQLLQRATGWDMPIDGLNYWVLGVPAPGVPWHERLDQWGRLQTLEQLGWDVRFLEYTRQGNYELPSKLFITRRLGDSDGRALQRDTLELRLVIQRWARLE